VAEWLGAESDTSHFFRMRALPFLMPFPDSVYLLFLTQRVLFPQRVNARYLTACQQHPTQPRTAASPAGRQAETRHQTRQPADSRRLGGVQTSWLQPVAFLVCAMVGAAVSRRWSCLFEGDGILPVD
jgi:hypothetical protein